MNNYIIKLYHSGAKPQIPLTLLKNVTISHDKLTGLNIYGYRFEIDKNFRNNTIKEINYFLLWAIGVHMSTPEMYQIPGKRIKKITFTSYLPTGNDLTKPLEIQNKIESFLQAVDFREKCTIHKEPKKITLEYKSEIKSDNLMIVFQNINTILNSFKDSEIKFDFDN